jgi:ABC-type multidrug transport system fused ATPase/permease subunit
MKNSVIYQALQVLPKKQQRKIFAILLIQTILGFLDLLGVALIGVLGALAVSGVTSNDPGSRISIFIRLLHLNQFEFQSQVAIIGLVATFTLILRTLLSIYFTKRILYFLSRESAVLSGHLLKKLLNKTLLDIEKKSSQDLLYDLTQGVTTVYLGIIGTCITLATDSTLMLILSIGLFVANPVLALSMLILFSILGYLLYVLMQKKARKLGRRSTELTVISNKKIVEVLSTYREIFIRGKRDYYARTISKIRRELADTQAELSFMPNVSKYVIESALLVGALLISASQFILYDSKHAVATLAIFLAAGTRIAPAILRLQQGALQLKSNSASSYGTLELIESLMKEKSISSITYNMDFKYEKFSGAIEVKDLEFGYLKNEDKVINSISFNVKQGDFIAFVGPTGSGKSTLVDLILGIIRPDSGSILISNKSPEDSISTWPGAIAYVPQEVKVIEGSIVENVGLGFDLEEIDTNLVYESLEKAQLIDFIKSMPDGIYSYVGERGINLSGGQKQRLGIARALYSKPKLIFLDEATSALDANTESKLTSTLLQLKGDVTVIAIAHRLSTVKNADKILYLCDGRIEAQGTFDDVRQSVPDFDSQAKLMGL